MRMVALQSVSIGQDLTPTIPPLTCALLDTHLVTHCSSCFSPLPTKPSTPSLHHCSPQCSLSTATTTAEIHLLHHHRPSADLRAALRLIHALSPPPPGQRILGLLTNHVTLTCSEIKEGAEAIREAMSVGGLGECDVVLAESVICLVVTNSVEVVDFDGLAVGVAVYDVGFSWINHSCSPNAVYRFSFCLPGMVDDGGESGFRIGPPDGFDGVDYVGCGSSDRMVYGCGGYGPRITVRSVKMIEKGDEVTVAYTDLLQPKEARQSHLWSKFRFTCQCMWCNASTYMDRSLQEIFVTNLELSCRIPDLDIWKEVAEEKYSNYVDDVIAEYLSTGHSLLCCQKLEKMLAHGLCVEQLEINEGLIKPVFRLNPLHHLSLNAYTALASAYKVCGSDLLALCSNIGRDQAFSMSRRSAAYSLILAGSTHHLFRSEPSIIVSVANFWLNAGESLLSLAESSIWTLFGIPASELTPTAKHKCCNCSLIDSFEANFACNEVQNEDFNCISNEFLGCVSNISKKVWSFLLHGSHCLKMYEDPIDYCWAQNVYTSRYWNSEGHSELLEGDGDLNCHGGNFNSSSKAQLYSNQERFHIHQLGVHSLVYGGYLASICYGPNFHMKSRIQKYLFTNMNT